MLENSEDDTKSLILIIKVCRQTVTSGFRLCFDAHETVLSKKKKKQICQQLLSDYRRPVALQRDSQDRV